MLRCWLNQCKNSSFWHTLNIELHLVRLGDLTLRRDPKLAPLLFLTPAILIVSYLSILIQLKQPELLIIEYRPPILFE